MSYNDVLRIIGAKNLAVNSSGGAVTSTTSVGSQTRVIELGFPAGANSTAGCRFAISDIGADSITSTTGAFLPVNWVSRYRCNPGMKVQAISHDGSAIPQLVIVELG